MLIVVSTNYAIIADGTTLAQMVDFDPMVESECHKQQKYRQVPERCRQRGAHQRLHASLAFATGKYLCRSSSWQASCERPSSLSR